MTESAPGSADVPTLRAGEARMPALGLGTWQVTGARCREIVERALELGYRHLDTAQAYGNEAEVGRAVERSGVARGEIFLTTKVWPENYAPEDFRGSVEASLERLRTDAVDLLLLHWPAFGGRSLEATVALLDEAREAGWARHVGVSNFTPSQLARAGEASSSTLATNQVEFHPFLAQDGLLERTRSLGMGLTAYCPLAQGRAARDPMLRAIGAEHGKSGAQVTLRWLLQHQGVAAIPRTSDPVHLEENLDVLDFTLSRREMRAISDMAAPDGRIIDPSGLAPDWEG